MELQEQRETNQIANFALVEWSDNINISDSQPSEYLTHYLDRLTIEDKTKMYYWHALPDNWEQMNYADFLIERRKRIALVVKDAYGLICK